MKILNGSDLADFIKERQARQVRSLRGAKIFPTGRSSVQIEYHQDDDYFELEITSASYEIYSMKGEDEFEGSVPKKDIMNHIKTFFT